MAGSCPAYSPGMTCGLGWQDKALSDSESMQKADFGESFGRWDYRNGGEGRLETLICRQGLASLSRHWASSHGALPPRFPNLS